MDVSVIFPGKYTQPETYRQTMRHYFIGMSLFGLEYMRVFTPDGTPGGAAPTDTPFFLLVPAGATLDFRYNRKRENWAISCEISGLDSVDDSPETICRYENSKIAIPYFRPIPLEYALVQRERFIGIQTRWQAGTPADMLAAGQLAAGLLAEYLTSHRPPGAESAVARFRRLIDEDVSFAGTLAELSRKAGAGSGYLRREFQRHYQIDPGEYRARRRLGRILELFGQSALSLKEIAGEVGMHHVTHLHAFLKERCGATPRELLLQHRGKGDEEN